MRRGRRPGRSPHGLPFGRRGPLHIRMSDQPLRIHRPGQDGAPSERRPYDVVADRTGATTPAGPASMVTILKEVSIQERVQLVVLRMLDERGVIAPRTVAEQCPGSDGGDLVAALDIMVQEGVLERVRPLSSATLVKVASSKGGMHLTEAGRRRLMKGG
jgi:hypothetical protein